MNERIRELYTQALEYADSRVLHKHRYNDIYYAIVSGKHAELIVKECAEKAYAGIGPDSLDAYDRGWQNGRNSAAQVIKEHFGVT